jgi:hypothetical protein
LSNSIPWAFNFWACISDYGKPNKIKPPTNGVFPDSGSALRTKSSILRSSTGSFKDSNSASSSAPAPASIAAFLFYLSNSFSCYFCSSNFYFASSSAAFFFYSFSHLALSSSFNSSGLTGSSSTGTSSTGTSSTDSSDATP